MAQEIEIEGGDRAVAPDGDGPAADAPLLGLATVAALAATLLVAGLILPWSEGEDGSVLSFASYPGQVVAMATLPTLMVLLAVGALQGRWWRGAMAASLVVSPATLWQYGPTLWAFRDLEGLGIGFTAQHLGGILALVATLVGLAAAVRRARGDGGPSADVAVLAASAVATALLVLSWFRDRIEITDQEVTTGVARWLRLEIPDGPVLSQVAYVVAPLAALGFVAWVALAARSGGGPSGRRRVELWTGLAAGVGLDVLARATSIGDLSSRWTGLPVVGDPPTVQPAVLGLALAIGAVVTFLVAGWLDSTAETEVADPGGQGDGALGGSIDDSAWAPAEPATRSPEQA